MSRYLQGVRYRQIAASYESIISAILRSHGISADQLPPATRRALVDKHDCLRRAAQLAFACGYLIVDLTATEDRYALKLRGAVSPGEIWVDARKTACDSEMWGQLKKNGARPPSRQLVEAFFAKISL